MKREWKPGDVAMVVNVVNEEKVARYANHFHKEPRWVFADGSELLFSEVTVARPLVVIDPEDRGQVERLADAFDGAMRVADPDYYRNATPWDGEEDIDVFRAALRELANPTPPKPDEPTGLGAVVEDTDGRLHIRTSLHLVDPWRSETDGTSRSWARVSAVSVLSEGVQP